MFKYWCINKKSRWKHQILWIKEVRPTVDFWRCNECHLMINRCLKKKKKSGYIWFLKWPILKTKNVYYFTFCFCRIFQLWKNKFYLMNNAVILTGCFDIFTVWNHQVFSSQSEFNKLLWHYGMICKLRPTC